MINPQSIPRNAQASIEMIHHVARRLGGDLLGQVAFLGGATLALLLTDPAISEVRPTRDVDVITKILTYGEYGQLSERLRQKGFQEDMTPGAPTCRWLVDGIVVDIMPTDENILGFSNRWYPGALQTATPYHLPFGVSTVEPVEGEEEMQSGEHDALIIIRLVTPFYFLATKLEAFASRGRGDIYASHDIEDVITLIDGRPELPNEIHAKAPETVREFIAASLRQLAGTPGFADAVEGHLPADARERSSYVLTQITRILSRH